MFKINLKKGYTLLFAVIVSAVVLSIAAFIVGTSRKQFILSSMARDSTIAIYAADSGIQCAVMAFGEGTLATSTGASISCYDHSTGAARDVSVLWKIDPSPEDIAGMGFSDDYVVYQTNSPIQFNLPNNTCVKITVTTGYYKDYLDEYKHKTVIESRGYNMRDSNGLCPAVNPRSIERAIRLQYMD